MSLAATLPAAHNARVAQPSRYVLVWLTVAVYWGISTLTRGALAAKALAAGQVEWGELPAVFAIRNQILTEWTGHPAGRRIRFCPSRDRAARAPQHRET